ncbi:uncharacterized protein METZ01_LOCUS262054, partial [marine metagenome]
SLFFIRSLKDVINPSTFYLYQYASLEKEPFPLAT